MSPSQIEEILSGFGGTSFCQMLNTTPPELNPTASDNQLETEQPIPAVTGPMLNSIPPQLNQTATGIQLQTDQPLPPVTGSIGKLGCLLVNGQQEIKFAHGRSPT